MKTTIRQTLAVIAGFLMVSTTAEAVTLAADFVITNRLTGMPIKRDHFKGKILVLDFIAHWSADCVSTSPKVQAEIAEYYKSRKGNPDGLPVEVVAVNIESTNPQATDLFIAKTGFKVVADDFGGPQGVWAKFGKGSVPHLVIINGVKGGTHTQWQVLHSAPDYQGAAFYRSLIDAVKGPVVVRAPEIAVEHPPGTVLVDGVSQKLFGSVVVDESSPSKLFTIRNIGNTNLTGLALRKFGSNSSDFIISRLPLLNLGPSESFILKVQFQPTAIGKRTATIRIISNDADENPFDIKVTGQGIAR